MYRPFMTCDDPKGVIECGTIRKSKGGSQKMEHKIITSKAQKKSNASLPHKAHKEETVSKRGLIEEYQGPTSFQLLEVSRGAHKLNQMIDSWSKGQNYGGQSKGIAKDLLKGALDLQESLAMLGKLQEASHYMARLKKKQKEKLEWGRVDGIEPQSFKSYRFGDQNFHMGSEKPRRSVDGTSKDCIEELKRVIADSLARQNLLPKTASQRKSLGWRNMDSASDLPSTSSSQSSMVHSDYTHSIDSPVLEAAPQKMVKGPNLIAKLMGLEDIPLQPLQKNVEKELDRQRNLSQRRPISDIEVPKVRKPQLLQQKTDPEQRSLKEILESMQFRGLLRSSSVKELKSQSDQARNLHSKERSTGDIQPIVLIKPCVQFRESEEAVVPIVWEEEALKRNMMSRQMKVKEKETPRSKGYRDLNGSQMYGKVQVEETQIKRLRQKGGRDHKELNEPEEKEIKIVVHEEVTMTGNKSCRKLDGEEIPIKRPQEQGAKDGKGIAVREKEKKAKAIVKNKSMVKASVSHQQQKEETTLKKIDKIQKGVDVGRKPVEKQMVKPENVSAKRSSTEERKPENRVTPAKTQLPQERSSKLKNISKHKAETSVYNSKGQKKKEKAPSDPAAEELTTENLECREDDKIVDVLCDNNSIPEGAYNVLADQLSTEDSKSSEISIQGHCSDSQTSCNIALPAIEYEQDTNDSEETENDIPSSKTEVSSFKTGSNLKALLLSSPSFLNHVEELFDLNTGSTQSIPDSGIDESEVADMKKLSLAYAKEYVELKSLSYSQARHSLLPSTLRGNSRIRCSRDQLVEEISNGVEVLRSYCMLPHEKFPTDTLYATLERDMNCKGVVSGVWELGWRSGFSVEEAEQTVNQIERSLVNDLIEELFTMF
ncbi:hypothetical protein Tsubulata_050291 [Turnera subulata]|uniref:DUF3741 domain-containing protein n=1 Tax=Turnera subulata TaxID=218843 RepID=A0A9Q0GD44_9ROSI|nr:hypothetical protein Tsubulata_050291 [Turnera subulata]